ncbi:MAG TPA: S8 family serine peptidase, partial [Rhizomicrobium sp.]|nr:S8 family serine peptidase [Rhizomicrobium sp.]
MATVLGASAAEASPATPTMLGQISLDAGSFFAPTQMDVNGAVYGVRARGRGTIGIVHGLNNTSSSVTPGPCGADTGVGWCDTPHDIAKNAFGWDFSAKGKGVIIGIIDTGIDLNHPEFAGRVLPGHCIKSSVNACANRDNRLGGDLAVFPGAADSTHGTHVTGIAAGTHTGLAPKADILPVKVCGSNVDSCIGIDQGMIWAANHGANIVSVSIGGPILDASDTAAFRKVASAGALMVVAAGNSGTKYPAGGFLSGAALADGVRGSMIVVGATQAGGKNGHGEAVSFTQVPGNRCEIHGGHSYCLKNYFVTAPGSDIWSTVGNGKNPAAMYGYLSGTSMATPYVSGVAALVKGQSPQLTAQQVAAIIFDTSDDIGAKGPDAIYGMGAVDVTRALSPVGETKVATRGGNPLNTSGPSGLQKTFVTGPLAVAVRNSTLLKHAYVVDSFGRTFQTDLTVAAQQHDYRNDYLFNNLMGAQFSTYSPFAFAGAGPFGNFVASGYAVGETTPRLLSGEHFDSGRTRYNVQDLSITTPLTDGVDLNIGYNMNISGRFNDYDAASSPAYDGLFMSASAVNSPYLSLTDGGAFLGTTVALGDNLHLRLGESSLTPVR